MACIAISLTSATDSPSPRDLLTESGSIFVQIGDENLHRVRALMDEVFGDQNSIALVTAAKTSSTTSEHLAGVSDYVLFYAKNSIRATKYRGLFHSAKKWEVTERANIS